MCWAAMKLPTGTQRLAQGTQRRPKGRVSLGFRSAFRVVFWLCAPTLFLRVGAQRSFGWFLGGLESSGSVLGDPGGPAGRPKALISPSKELSYLNVAQAMGEDKEFMVFIVFMVFRVFRVFKVFRVFMVFIGFRFTYLWHESVELQWFL